MESDHEGSLGSDAMEEELDEDIYGVQDTKQNGIKSDPDSRPLSKDAVKPEDDDDEDDDDEDSDLDIIIESNDPAATTQPTNERFSQATVKTEGASQSQKATSSQPARSSGPSASTPQSAAQASLHLPTDLTLRDGRTYPEHKTSRIEVNGDPLYNGKPISELDIDVDLAEHLKPWRVPGADPADWFNYGFDEFTFAQYQMKRKQMAGEVQAMPSMGSMDSFFSNMMQGMMPGDMGGQQQDSGTPNSMNAGGAQGMGGMPDEQTMMAIMQQMGMQGGNPMQNMPGQMQGMGGQGQVNNAPSGPAGWQQGGGGGAGARRGGRGGHRGW